MATFSRWFLKPCGCLLAYSCAILDLSVVKACKDLKWQRSMSRGQLNLFLKAACQRPKKASYPFCKYFSNWSAFSIKSAAMADNLINRNRTSSCIPNPDKSTMTSSIRKPTMIILVPEAFRLSPYRMMKIPITTRSTTSTYFCERRRTRTSQPHPLRIQLPIILSTQKAKSNPNRHFSKSFISTS